MRSRAGTAVFQLSPCPFTSVVGQQRQSLPPFFEMVGASHLNATDQRQQTLRVCSSRLTLHVVLTSAIQPRQVQRPLIISVETLSPPPGGTILRQLTV